jgi:CIC family chloride channel protein
VPLGPEDPALQMGAGVASLLGRVFRLTRDHMRLIAPVGAAAGIAAAYNAPIAGAVFAAQIVLGNFSMSLFAPLVFASVVATMISRSFFGMAPAYHVPSFDFARLTQLPWFLLLGLAGGALGGLFLRALNASERGFAQLNVPLYIRVTLGGLAVGTIALWYPEVWGNGYSVASHLLQVEPHVGWLAGLLVAKMVATALTVGSGTVGGVFTPTLFLGVALGSLFGLGLNELGFARTLPNGVFGLAGMGALLAATTHSPLLAMILVFEISLDYSLMPALMLASVVSSLISRAIHPASIYTEPLRQKGLLEGGEKTELGAATQQTVGELMHIPVPPLAQTATLPEIAERFLTSPNNFLPVVDDQQRLLGLVALQDLKEFLNAGQEMRGVIAADVMRPPPACLTPGQRLMDALPVLLASELRNVPVISSNQDRKLVGSVLRAEALGRLSEAIAAKGDAGQ